MNNVLNFVGLPVGALIATEQLGLPSGLENISAVAVLGFLMWIVLKDVCRQLGQIGDKLDAMATKDEATKKGK